MKKQTREDLNLVFFGIGVFILMFLIGVFLAGVNILAPGNELYLGLSLAGAFGPFYVIISDRIRH